MGSRPGREEVRAPAQRDEVRRIGRSPDAHAAVALLDVIERQLIEGIREVQFAPAVHAQVVRVKLEGDASTVTSQDGFADGGGHRVASHRKGPRTARSAANFGALECPGVRNASS